MGIDGIVTFIMQILRLTHEEIAEWCGVSQGAVTKWVRGNNGLEHSQYGSPKHGSRKPHPDNLQKLLELRREARCVAAFKVDPEIWRARGYKYVNGKATWSPVWEQFVIYSCASAQHYPHDDADTALKDFGAALLTDDDAEFNIKILPAALNGDVFARCYGKGNDWKVLVKKDLSEEHKREEVVRELQAHVFHVKPNPDGLRVEHALKGAEGQTALRPSSDLIVDDSPTRREMNHRYRTWVLKRSNDAASEKRAIARHVATHIMRPQMLVQIASGTTENCLMDEIISNEIEDIQITTNNLQVLVKGLRAAHLGNSVNLTGGTLNASIDSLIGPDAARAIADDRYMPHAVFFGAAGLSFQDRLCISYAFEDEEATQVAYATRPTETRVLMADDSKLGRTCGRRAPVSLEQMMHTANESIVVSNYRDDAADRIDAEIEALKKLLEPLIDAPEYRIKNFSLRFVDIKGSTHREYSLRGLRQGKW